jgi:hypothetical protein
VKPLNISTGRMTGDSDIIVGLGKSCRLLGAAKRLTMEDIFSAVANFRGGTPLSDDCTIVDLMYSG